MIWQVSKSDKFTVRSLYFSLTNCRIEAFPSSIVWNTWVPLKVDFFAGEVLWERILTLDQLKRRGWRLPSRCCLWKGEEETDLILLHYSSAVMLW